MTPNNPTTQNIQEIDTIRNLKHIIHGETSITQIMLWIIFWKLFGGWVGFLAAVMIVGNVISLFKAASKLPKNYYE